MTEAIERELSSATEEKLNAAKQQLAGYDSALVAFSGGVDSGVVAAIAYDVLGEDAVACTARSETLPEAELETAQSVADEIGIPHDIVSFSELESDAFVSNDDERCYHCRSMRLSEMSKRANELDVDVVCEGTNVSDFDAGHRPGLAAVQELDAISPLADNDINKSEVRDIAEHYELSVADKPSMACLSSRIPTGIEVTEERLSRVEKAEQFLRSWGFEQFRVRDHDGLARIEVNQAELDVALSQDFASAAEHHLRELGFDHVTLDLAGYQTGSVSPDN